MHVVMHCYVRLLRWSDVCEGCVHVASNHLVSVTASALFLLFVALHSLLCL